MRSVPAQSWLVSLYMDCPPNLGITCPSNEEVEVSILFVALLLHRYARGGHKHQAESREKALWRQ